MDTRLTFMGFVQYCGSLSNMLDMNLRYLTRVATNIDLTENIKYSMLKTPYINKKYDNIIKRF